MFKREIAQELSVTVEHLAFFTVNNKGTNFNSELVEAFETCTSFRINVVLATK
ncbi:hypothetical protein GPUN_1906 [Glaciecola punicea ACAM 611]|jgi:hypothetical protein|uniref:Uncharacterized protein n=1 Tax=Glaciecola punicea ACAM 611 TaxID=1121923 RepID=H5TCJ5_9ALTE|nr:hypothetical protein [Glaciecola punicea]GAB56022.1 hypothetical protein GPUN_1906 [Glaciecola punicea ACAM 611]